LNEILGATPQTSVQYGKGYDALSSPQYPAL